MFWNGRPPACPVRLRECESKGINQWMHRPVDGKQREKRKQPPPATRSIDGPGPYWSKPGGSSFAHSSPQPGAGRRAPPLHVDRRILACIPASPAPCFPNPQGPASSSATRAPVDRSTRSTRRGRTPRPRRPVAGGASTCSPTRPKICINLEPQKLGLLPSASPARIAPFGFGGPPFPQPQPFRRPPRGIGGRSQRGRGCLITAQQAGAGVVPSRAAACCGGAGHGHEHSSSSDGETRGPY